MIYTKQEWYTPAEVAVHNRATDCWVSLNGKLATTILAFAGKDVSHWFKGEDWVNYTHPLIGSASPYLPFGPARDQPVVPSTRWRPLSKVWWQNEDLIMMRYLPHNAHCMSYAWRYLGKALCLNFNLERNGIPDERERFSDVALPENMHIPAILVYYNDDLTEDPPRDDCFCHDLDCLLNLPEKCYAEYALP
ncbi:Uncharacterized protein OBRU01_16190, partial [Operophtera brumata]